MLLIRIVGSAIGEPSPWDGQYVVAYDPSRDSISPEGIEMRMYLRTTRNSALAKRFESLGVLTNFYCQVDPREPFAPNGRPNRPLTYFTIEIEPAGAAIEMN